MVTALPVLFSGIVFIRSFAEAIAKDTALGANLIGSLVGGLLQSVTFITGIKALLLMWQHFIALQCSAALTFETLFLQNRNMPFRKPKSTFSPLRNRNYTTVRPICLYNPLSWPQSVIEFRLFPC
jgi:hypothetical protein